MSALEAPRPRGPSAEQETARLFAAHSAEILAFCRRQLTSGSDAEDALQTTFVYVLRAIRRGVVPENEHAWLTTIAKNVCHTQRRTQGRRGALSTALDLDRIALAQPEPD
jgi:DNA-directed RNA polymerase specialized sigma24 family protein